MRKVLIAGPRFYDYNYSIERAFKNLGFETKVASYYPRQVSSATERIQYHLSADKEAFFERIETRFNNHLLDLYSSFKPDLVVIIQGNVLYKETLEKMTGCKKALWMMDSLTRYHRSYELRNSVDNIFLFEKTDIEKLWNDDRISGNFLALALDEKVYYPISNRKKDIDILFIGALYENRIALLEKVAQQFRDCVIKVYGHFYSPLRRPFYHLFRENKNIFLNKNIAPATVNELYNCSKICLNIHHEQSKYGVNQRFFEISGSRSFQLVDNNAYITDNFSGTEIVTYGTLPELFEKMDQALKNAIDTDAIAGNAYKKIISNHTFTHRVRYLLDVMKFDY